MGRIPEFDRSAVLSRAAQQFAEYGYEGTSMSRLVEATGLQRGSIYAAFGSKAELFRESFTGVVDAPGLQADLLTDLLTVALRERAAVDGKVADGAVRAIARLGEELARGAHRSGSPQESSARSGTLVAHRLFARLLDRAGIADRVARTRGE
ncbi:helix-turn-helix domain-containing protein [Brevibacterium samyangense]|uniref:HTH tetR-type domain-containing protein n=1 Tax=Brevibacterium samyangense TaxID=366888 RepID=A0ABP5EWG3_9MICO